MKGEASGDRAIEVPFVDLFPVHSTLRSRILDDLSSLIDTGEFVNGPAVARFETAFAAHCGTGDCVGLSSGLDALRLALLALEIGPGDEVVVPAHTFIATAEAVRQTGATPVLVDVAEEDRNLDPARAEAAITGRTRALMPVHLYGQLADMSRLRALVDGAAQKVAIVEDAAQAHGAVRDGWRAGAAGAIGCFSFYPAKNLGALGDAGAATTDDPRLAARLRALREHGQFEKHVHAISGYTARLDTLQALVLLRKLPLLDEWNELRRKAARVYDARLAGVGDLGLPPVAPGSVPVWQLYVVTTRHPERLAAALRRDGVATGRHYPTPIHLTEAFQDLGHRPGDFPVAEGLAAQGLSLPIFPGITEEQLEAVIAGVRGYFARHERTASSA